MFLLEWLLNFKSCLENLQLLRHGFFTQSWKLILTIIMLYTWYMCNLFCMCEINANVVLVPTYSTGWDKVIGVIVCITKNKFYELLRRPGFITTFSFTEQLMDNFEYTFTHKFWKTLLARNQTHARQNINSAYFANSPYECNRI